MFDFIFPSPDELVFSKRDARKNLQLIECFFLSPHPFFIFQPIFAKLSTSIPIISILHFIRPSHSRAGGYFLAGSSGRIKLEIEYYFPSPSCTRQGAGIRVCYGCAEDNYQPCVSPLLPSLGFALQLSFSTARLTMRGATFCAQLMDRVCIDTGMTASCNCARCGARPPIVCDN